MSTASIIWPTLLTAQTSTGAFELFQYIDLNKDGRNDRFVDADGDGKNDLTGQDYPHSFSFLDRNDDGLNDLWRDQDGDGVNDLALEFAKNNGDVIPPPWIDNDGDGLPDGEQEDVQVKNIHRYLLDHDLDGKNDITGHLYQQDSSLAGYRYGIVDEERNVMHKKFVDLDGDGMDDRSSSNRMGHRRDSSQKDFFIDQDGDGIRDGRGIKRMHRHGSKGKSRR